MQPITLTTEQRERLLEMAKYLFPEWKYITFHENANMGAGWAFIFDNICFSHKSETIFDIEENIHWFEFCMTHLFTKLIVEKYSYESIVDAVYNGCYNGIHGDHPVEYLYKIFLTQKP